MSGIRNWRGTSACGTRAAYTRGCRCEACRAANAKRYRDRAAEARARSGEVTPTGAPIADTMVRAGREYRIERCPGGNGAPCVVPGGAWLKRPPVCMQCVRRIVMWDGLVDASRARAHILALRRRGIGRDQVADAAGVSAQRVAEIAAAKGPRRIHAQTEKRILEVDEGARADGASVPAAHTNRLIEWLVGRGFRRYELARLLGYAPDAPALQIGKRRRVLLSTAHKVERLVARVKAGELAPAPRKPARIRPIGDATRAELEELRRRGVELVAGAELERQLEALRELRAVDERRMRRAS